MMRILLAALVVICSSGVALAEQKLLLSPIYCRVTAEYQSNEHMLHIRLLGNPGKDCLVTPADVATALDRGLVGHDDLQSIFLGRFQEYPWIASRILERAVQDGAWDGSTGKARIDGGNNAYVAGLFAGPPPSKFDQDDLLWRIRQTLGRHGYMVVGASAEKVITQNVTWRLSGDEKRRLPTDALVHLRIEKTP
jgi:hypothetical protein